MIRHAELKQDIADLNHRLELIQTVLLVSNPESQIAVDAYDGLRKTIVQSLSATKALHAVIAQLDSIASDTGDIEDVKVKLNELMAQYGIVKVHEYEALKGAFDRIGDGPTFQVIRPAYVAGESAALVLMGVAQTSENPSTPEPPADIKVQAAPAEEPEPVDGSAPSDEGNKGDPE